MSDIRERLARAIEQEIDRDFSAWLARWTTPAGVCDDAPDPPKSNWRTSPEKIADAALAQLPLTQAQLEGLASGDMVVVSKASLKPFGDNEPSDTITRAGPWP